MHINSTLFSHRHTLNAYLSAMSSSHLIWSRQLRRDQNDHQQMMALVPTKKRYQRPPRMSELVKEINYLKQEALEKINLEEESQKTFESIQKQIDTLRHCFESFTSMMVDEVEDLRKDQLRTLEDVHESEDKNSSVIQSTVESTIQTAVQPICDEIERNASIKMANIHNELRAQINELRNLMILNAKTLEQEKMNRIQFQKEQNGCNQYSHFPQENRPGNIPNSFPTPCEPNDRYQSHTEYTNPPNREMKSVPEYQRSSESEAIAALTNTVARQQDIIEDLKSRIRRIDRNITTKIDDQISVSGRAEF